MKNVAVSIYCDEELLSWIDSLPGRSRSEKIVDLVRQARERHEQSGNLATLQGLQTCVSGLVEMLVDKEQLTQLEARQLLMKHVADAERLVSDKGKKEAAEYYGQYPE